MVLKVSSPRIGGVSDSECVSDPEEKEFSDNDDDDRNHKHRRLEGRSQSTESESSEQVPTRPYRKRNRTFENGHTFRDNEPGASDCWTGKFDRRRFGRGRGRVSGSWHEHAPAFSSINAAPQMFQQHGIPPTLFTERGMPDLSNSHSASWGSFGIIPGVPSGSLDTVHPMGVQGTLRPVMNPPLNMGVSRHRCRDFEERGFCLRGDMCPMEHGVNRIVVDDVQSLSQFNLPVGLPSAHLHGGPGAVPSVRAPSALLVNNKGLYSRSGKPGIADDDLELNGGYTGLVNSDGADLYDPDQPLWNNDGPESYLNDNPFGHHRIRKGDTANNEYLGEGNRSALGSQNTNSSVWGRFGSSILKRRPDGGKNLDIAVDCSNYVKNECNSDQDAIVCAQESALQGKRTGSSAMNLSSNSQGYRMNSFRKPYQKAQRTLCVSSIPQKDNKNGSLLSHFRKFGEVIKIFIPSNSERAFVQFSKIEEAEAALKAPDAVMGNRFIKLAWANRDSISDNLTGGSLSLTPHDVAGASVSRHPPNAHRNNDKLQYAVQKHIHSGASDAAVPSSDRPKPVITNDPKNSPSSQKKQERLELLKEALRKKQELLDQKRNDFKRQLEKLQKQTSGIKGNSTAEQTDMENKVEVEAETAPSVSTDHGNHGVTTATSSEKNCSVEIASSTGPERSVDCVLPDFITLKQQFRPFLPVRAPFPFNRYKLDNRPTAFKVLPPVPPGFANVDVLKEHFSSFGDEPTVELEDAKTCEGSSGSEISKACFARITFTTRQSAEKAYIHGKCWQGHKLQLMWLTPSSSNSACKGKSLSTSKEALEADVQTAGKLVCDDSQGAASLGDGEAEESERKGCVEHVEKSEEFHVEVSPTSYTKNKSPDKSDLRMV